MRRGTDAAPASPAMRRAAPLLMAGALLLLSRAQASATTSDRAITTAIRKELAAKAIPKKLQTPTKRTPQWMAPDAAALLVSQGDHVYMPVGHMASQEMEAALIRRSALDDYSATNPVHIVGLTNTASKKLFDRTGRIRALSLFNGHSNRDSVSRGHGKFVPAQDRKSG